ncbi:MAG: ArsR/SmtB family transcription factor [Terracidiphilus sp.]
MSMPPADSEFQCSPSRLARILFALADPMRLRILALILDRELNAQQLAQILGLDPHIVARHITCLRDGGVVSMRRHGKRVYYSVRPQTADAASKLVHLTLNSLLVQS